MRHRIYVESTVWYQMANFSDSELKDRVGQFFEYASAGRYSFCISNVVLEELEKNNERYRIRVEELLARYKPQVFMQNGETEDVADAYIENAFKGRPVEDVFGDAMHAAAATTGNISYMASWNWRHLLNVRYIENINAVNMLAGYNHNLSILPPFMFVDMDHFEGDRGGIHDQVWEIKRGYGRKMIELKQLPPTERLQYHQDFALEVAKRLGLELVDVNRKLEYL